MTTSNRPDAGRLTNPDDARGNMVWVVIMSVLLFVIASILINASMSQVFRTRAATETQLVSQQVQTGESAAIESLNSGTPLPVTLATGATACQTISKRPLCNLMWATPVPGQAGSEAIRFNLLLHTWVDQDRNAAAPDAGVRSTLVPLDAITYQDSRISLSGATIKPKVMPGGYVEYPSTPLSLFGNAIHAYTSATLTGPTFDLSSYNSIQGTTGTLNGVMSSDGTVAYGADTKVDRTVLYGGASTAGNYTERCTGEACGESDVRVLTDTHATPTADTEDWMRSPSLACSQTFTGDWIASKQGAHLPGNITCVRGNLIIDVPTTRSAASATLYVYGNVIIQESLNLPATGMAKPGSLQIYTTGTQVVFNSTNVTAQGIGVAALIDAPLATCGNKPIGNNKVTYYGSLVCNIVSIAGPWSHQYDEAQTVGLSDPVPGAKKVWTLGPEQKVGVGDYTEPEGWGTSSCAIPPLTNADGYWKLDELTGNTAADSSGKGRAGVYGAGVNRQTGKCGAAAPFVPAGAATYTSSPMLVNTVNGMTVSWWANNPLGVAFQAGGVKVEHTANSHIQVTSGGVTATVPFTIQGIEKWHRYTVSVSSTGVVRLYVDGAYKDTVTTAAPSATGGNMTLGAGSRGLIDEVSYFTYVWLLTDVQSDWTTWCQTVDTVTTYPGDAFTAPSGLIDNGTTAFSLKLAWAAATGTLSGPGTTDAVYQVQYATTPGGATTVLGSVAKTQGTYALTVTPPLPIGLYYYQVCTVYNGDSKCSPFVPAITVPLAAAPNITVSAITETTATFSWNAPSYADAYESQYRINSGSWQGAGGVVNAVISHGATRTITHGPTTSGANFEVRVRSLNAAGTGAWSAIALARFTLPAPGVWGNGVDTTRASFSWSGHVNAAKYQTQVSLNNGAWYGSGGTNATTFDLGTANSWVLGPTTQGTNIRIIVRMVNVDGTPGPWSAPASQNLLVDAPTTTSYNLWAGSWQFQTSVNASCPAGTTIVWTARDQVAAWGGAWNSWAGWSVSSDATMTGTFTSLIQDTTNSANQDYVIACQGYGSASAGVGYSVRDLKHVTTGTPNASVDVVSAHPSFWVGGWTYDPSIPLASIYVHIYFDIYTPSAIGINTGFARTSRTDVGAAYPGVGNYHGFNLVVSAPVGYHRVTIYAIGIDGNNVCIYDQYVTIS